MDERPCQYLHVGSESYQAVDRCEKCHIHQEVCYEHGLCTICHR